MTSRILFFATFIFLLFVSWKIDKEFSCVKTNLGFTYKKNPGVNVWNIDSTVIAYTSEMSIDADGSPQAYNPQNTGIDDTMSAYSKKLKKLSPNVVFYKEDTLYIQGKNDPFPGYYLSMTKLENPNVDPWNYKRYVNSDSIPYISVPPNLLKSVKMGDIAYVYNKKTGKGCFAIIADVGDNTHIGEGSIRLADKLGIKITYKKTKHQIIGCDASGDITYLIFPNSGTGKPLTESEIENKSQEFTAEKIDFYLKCLGVK